MRPTGRGGKGGGGGWIAQADETWNYDESSKIDQLKRK